MTIKTRMSMIFLNMSIYVQDISAKEETDRVTSDFPNFFRSKI